jgi:cytochrome c biogenesis protein CcdA
MAQSKIETKSNELKKYGRNLSVVLGILLILTILALPIKD